MRRKWKGETKEEREFGMNLVAAGDGIGAACIFGSWIMIIVYFMLI